MHLFVCTKLVSDKILKICFKLCNHRLKIRILTNLFCKMSLILFKKLILAFLLCIHNTNANGNNKCFQDGSTWSTNGQLDFISNVLSVQDCVKMCLEIDDCKGYTWYGDLKRQVILLCHKKGT